MVVARFKVSVEKRVTKEVTKGSNDECVFVVAEDESLTP